MDMNLQMRKRKSRWMFILTGTCTLFSLLVLFYILGYITVKGMGAISIQFLTNLPAPLGEKGGGIANAIVGSMKLVGAALLLAVPIGVLGAVYLAEYGNNRVGFWIRYSSDLLNGIPSIVVGIFAYSILVLPMRHFSAISGAVALAIIMIPFVLRNAEEFIRLVPRDVREGALALGIPQWKVILRVVLPSASRGILTGVVLGVSRVAGETAPLLFTAFGNRFWDDGWMNPIATLPTAIFTYAISPYPDWHEQAWAAAFVLLAVVLFGNILARTLLQSKHEGASH